MTRGVSKEDNYKTSQRFARGEGGDSGLTWYLECDKRSELERQITWQRFIIRRGSGGDSHFTWSFDM